MPATATTSASKMDTTSDVEWEVGSEALCFNGPQLYEVKIIELKDGEEEAKVHWKGFNERHDCWVPFSHLNEMTLDNLEYQKELHDAKRTENVHIKKKHAPKSPAKKKRTGQRKAPPSEETARLTEVLDAMSSGGPVATEESHFSKHSARIFTSQLREVFHLFDEDNSNSIDREELAHVMRSLGRRAVKSKIDAMFELLDTDNSGSIDFEEFCRYFKHEQHSEVDDTPYCSCREPFNNRFMIACDGHLKGCFDWYHGDCVGVSSEDDIVGPWFCPHCLENYPDKVRKLSNFINLNGKKYDKAMIEQARAAEQKTGKIGLTDAKKLIEQVLADDTYSKIERRTMKYIREHLAFTPQADKWARHAIHSHAGKIAARTREQHEAEKKAAETGGRKKRARPAPKAPAAKRAKKQQETKAEAKEAAASKPKRTTSILSREALDRMIRGTTEQKQKKKTAFNTATARKFKADLRRVFRRIDKDKSNSLDKDELAQMMRSLGKRPMKKRIDAIFDTLDTDNDGTVDFEEFVKYFSEKDTFADSNIYCSCESKSGGKFMVACDANFDGCAHWYHGECVGISEDAVPDVWFCKKCVATGKTEDLEVVVVGKKKFDRTMIETARHALHNNASHHIEIDDAKALIEAVLADEHYSKIEKATMHYLRTTFPFTPEAREWLETAIRKWAATQSAATRAANKAQELDSKKVAARASLIAWMENHENPTIKETARHHLSKALLTLGWDTIASSAVSAWSEVLGGRPLLGQEVWNQIQTLASDI